jgi:hypothetical protein
VGVIIARLAIALGIIVVGSWVDDHLRAPHAVTLIIDIVTITLVLIVIFVPLTVIRRTQH